ncbi:MAG: hypothetical protein HY897_03005 [Deltaproteobacteria bacterium]|nr:hypothetical protein [Deltaproteobacteria bacterium]
MWRDWVRKWFPTLAYEHVFITYLPNKDRHGNDFDVEPWDTRILRLQARLFRGATSYPSRGSYRTLDAQGRGETGIMVEATRMIVSFVNEGDLTEAALKEITDVLKDFGHKTRQESVAFVVDGEMYYIDMIAGKKKST